MHPTNLDDSKPVVIRVVIAEDQALVRRGTVLLLSMEPDMELVGQASNGEEAVQLTRLLHPDVVLMDLHMPVKRRGGGHTRNHPCAARHPGVGAHDVGRR